MVFCTSVSANCSGMAAPRLLKGYLLCSTVLWFWLRFASHSWRIVLDLLHHGCDLNLRICTKHCVFSSKRRFGCGEKLARLRDGFGRRRFTVKSCSNCARNGAEGCRWLFLFFVDAVLLCVACVAYLCALELLHPSDVLHSSVLQFFSALQLSVCRSQWNGCTKPSRRILVLQYHVLILIVFCKSRNIVFFRLNGGSAAEKSWLACATGAGVLALP